MGALTGEPGRARSARVEDVAEPRREDGAGLVRTLSVGICGTDAEIVAGHYGWAPPGRRRLILGHESIGQVEEAPAGSGFAVGDLAVGDRKSTTSELQSLMRVSYAVFCLKKKKQI